MSGCVISAKGCGRPSGPAPGSDPVSGAPADEEAAQRLVHELGRLALAENEAWLKSRRKRPLTPIVG